MKLTESEKKPLVEVIKFAMDAYGITWQDIQKSMEYDIYDALTREDPDEAAWIANNVDPSVRYKKQIEVRYEQ